MCKSIETAISILNDSFDKFNTHFYHSELEKPIITIQRNDKRKDSYGWFTTSKVWKSTDSDRYEINLSAEYLDRDINYTLTTLLHEMVHLYCAVNNIQDCSRSGTYHNKKYKSAAEEHGLNVECDNKYGWTKTSLTDDTRNYFNSLGIEQIDLKRQQQDGATTKKKIINEKIHLSFMRCNYQSNKTCKCNLCRL